MSVSTIASRCHACPDVVDAFDNVDRHVTEEHGGRGRIEIVLEQTVTTKTPASAGGAEPNVALEDRGTRAAGSPSEGTGPASSDDEHELPSDDNRALYEPPAETPRRRFRPGSRARRSLRHPDSPTSPALPTRPTAEERKAMERAVAAAREAIDAAKQRGRGEAA